MKFRHEGRSVDFEDGGWSLEDRVQRMKNGL